MQSNNGQTSTSRRQQFLITLVPALLALGTLQLSSTWREVRWVTTTAVPSSYWEYYHNFTIESSLLDDLEQQKQLGDLGTTLKTPTPTVSSLVIIPINPNSTLASDIKEIWHDKSNFQICVAIKSGARCPDPQLIGRLSGPTLALLEWQWDPRFSVERNNFTALCGSYQSDWLVPGQQYFVEILGLFCHNFGVETLARTHDLDSWLAFDFQSICLENTKNNHLTLDGAYIETDSSPAPVGPRPISLGRWRSTAISKNKTIQPLYTRHQPPECRNPKKTDELFCAETTNASAHYNFEFEWRNDSWISELQEYQNAPPVFMEDLKPCQYETFDPWRCVKAAQVVHLNKTSPKICMVGCSHSYYMTYSMMMLNFGERVYWIPRRSPEDITLAVLSEFHQDLNCVKFIIATGQWPAGHPGGYAYLFEQYAKNMSQVLYQIQNASSSSSDAIGFQVYMRSIHHVPICQLSSICPPKDWRTPPVMDGYSYLVRKAVEDINMTGTIQYIDTSFITAPLWDISQDWNHLPRLVSDVEATYVLAAVLGVLPPSAVSDKSILHLV